MTFPRPFLTRRSASGRCLSLSKSFREFRTQESAVGPLQLTVSNGCEETEGVSSEEDSSSRWAELLPELIADIIARVEAAEAMWPGNRSIVACGSVCKKWREVTREIVMSPLSSGKITLPLCLKQPGPGDWPLQCLIKRDKRNSTFHLYLSVSPSSFTEQGKFLLAARRNRQGPYTEYIISLDANDISQGSRAYVGKLRSDFVGTNFTIYDSEPPHDGAKSSRSKSTRRFASKQISPQVPAGNFEVGKVSYKFNLLRSKGPRRMVCLVNSRPLVGKKQISSPGNLSLKKLEPSSSSSPSELAILRNKAPRWLEHLQCWCLNFHGHVTVASVKNIQLIADQNQAGGKDIDETVVLQFGKVGDDSFTMDFQQPLSAFQAFAICLTSFGTKLACE